MKTAVKKRSVVLAGHRTSISLEEAFWQALREIAEARRQSINALVGEVDTARGSAAPSNLSSALRVFILDCCRRGELSALAPPTAPETVAPEA